MKILLLNRNHIGDALFTTPAIAALRAALPDARLVNAVSRGTEPLFERNPHITENWSRSPTWPDDSAFLRRARKARFDAVVNFTTSSTLLAVYAWLSGARRRIGFDVRDMRLFLTDRVPLKETEQHHADDTLDLARALVPVTRPFPMELFVDPAWNAEWRAALGGLEPGAGRPWVGLNPGATVPRNRWPVERWAELARYVSDTGSQPILFGGPADAEAVAAIETLLPAPVPSVQGKLSLRGLPAAIRQCAAFVSGDTGPMHVAVSVGTPVVALFGPANPHRTGPYTDRAVIIHHRATDPDAGPMDAVSVEEVAAAVPRAVAMGRAGAGGPAGR